MTTDEVVSARPARPSRSLASTPPEILFIVSASAQYSGAVIAVRLFDDVAPATVAWFRVIAAAAILLAFSARRARAPWTRADLAWAAVFGTVTALMNLFFYLAIDRLPLGKGVTIEFIGPIAVAALTTRTTRNTVALVAAAVGVAVLGGVELSNEPLGLVFIFLASLMWAGYIVAGSRVALADRGVAGLGFGLAVGSVVMAPFCLSDAGTVVSSPTILLACAAVGLLSNAIGYGIDQSTLRRIPVRRFSVLLALLPVCAAVFGFLFLDQTPTTVDLVGMVLVLAGVALQEREVIERHQPARATT